MTRILAQAPPRSRSRREIVSARLSLATPALLPELRLYRAGPASGLGRLASGAGAPYWAYPWAGGLALARYLLDHPETVAGKRVLDLGAGGGLVAIAAMKAGAREATAIDVDPDAIAAIALNAEANAVAVAALCGDPLDGPPPDGRPRPGRRPVLRGGPRRARDRVSRPLPPGRNRRAGRRPLARSICRARGSSGSPNTGSPISATRRTRRRRRAPSSPSFEEGRLLADVTLDLRGLNCPLPILRARKALRALPPGSALEVFADDPLSPGRLRRLLRGERRPLVESVETRRRLPFPHPPRRLTRAANPAATSAFIPSAPGGIVGPSRSASSSTKQVAHVRMVADVHLSTRAAGSRAIRRSSARATTPSGSPPACSTARARSKASRPISTGIARGSTIPPRRCG